MIPKVIHYCWFGRNPKPELINKCIESWKKFCPDYEIKEWNEDNFDIHQCPYVEEAYECKKWAFVSDCARLKIIYDNGGIYLDTDVELLDSLDNILKYDFFFAFEHEFRVNTGYGFGAKKMSPIVQEMLSFYLGKHFIVDGKTDLTVCTISNTDALMKEFAGGVHLF